ncbi:MAG: DUF3179 domain-containing protein [Anaerolineales bacterium]|nr:DUF3179 domain-containing protein [Anaerolineales bacterium]
MNLGQIIKPNKKWLIASVLLISACAGVASGGITAPSGEQNVEEAQIEPAAIETNTQENNTVTNSPETALPPSIPKVLPDLLPDELPPLGADGQFTTDFSRHTVLYSDILSGGPPKDGIPAIDNPTFTSVQVADEYLEDLEPVVFLQIGEDARAYPLQVLTWHEIVNDVVDGKPVAVTFCPLCNTAIAFDSTFDGQQLDFGTTGRLRFSNLIMYDRQTETWWQQATGEAIAGEYAGQQLTFLPASIIGWGEFKENFPEGQVLSRETGFNRDYGRNPYAGYDNINNSPFLFRGPQTPGVLPAMARVLTIDLESEAVAYPYELLQAQGAVNDTLSGSEIVVLWQPGTASALDASRIAEGEDVGAGVSFSRTVDGQVLTFSFDGKKIVDDQTGSEWDVFGQAIRGELAGTQLEPIVSVNHFWFSWAAFKPETRIYQE